MICASIVEMDPQAAIRAAIEACDRGANLVEIRFDVMPRLPHDLSPFSELPITSIATLRTREQGGSFSGSEEERLNFFQSAVDHFDLVDVELGSEILSGIEGRAEVICSFHRFEPGATFEEIVWPMKEAGKGGHISKGAFMVDSVSDLHALVRASRELRELGGRFILVGMGSMGEITRIRAVEMGCHFTYASMAKGKEAAPGQLDIEMLRRLSTGTLTGIIGYPLSHSLSPQIHQAAFDHLGLDGRYLVLPTQPEELSSLVEVLRELSVRGINVTIPHKEAIIPFLDEVDQMARLTGAVNTIVNSEGRLTGMNTDVDGVAGAFLKAGISPKGMRALIIGAGGAARACCAFLVDAGSSVSLVNRSLERAKVLAQHIKGVRVISRSEALRENFDIIVNCTPLGMKGFPDESLIDPTIFREGQFVMDTVYNPPLTTFLREAEKRGAFICSGTDMLIYQAIAAFEVWTGVEPPYGVMAEALREELK
jgi:shikimate dehydrogenase/3-dehydroquinate dehydratase type I